ncbi:MAG: hypothetical protein U0790_27265 [Isosphaeraceae bacterium]
MTLDHLKQNGRGMTKLVVSFPVTQREGLAELSVRLGLSQQNLIRSAVARLLEDHRPRTEAASEPEPRRRRGRPRKNRGDQ